MLVICIALLIPARIHDQPNEENWILKVSNKWYQDKVAINVGTLFEATWLIQDGKIMSYYRCNTWLVLSPSSCYRDYNWQLHKPLQCSIVIPAENRMCNSCDTVGTDRSIHRPPKNISGIEQQIKLILWVIWIFTGEHKMLLVLDHIRWNSYVGGYRGYLHIITKMFF